MSDLPPTEQLLKLLDKVSLRDTDAIYAVIALRGPVRRQLEDQAETVRRLREDLEMLRGMFRTEQAAREAAERRVPRVRLSEATFQEKRSPLMTLRLVLDLVRWTQVVTICEQKDGRHLAIAYGEPTLKAEYLTVEVDLYPDTTPEPPRAA